LLLLGTYYSLGKSQDGAKSMAAYEQLLELQPNNTAGLNNLGNALLYRHQYARAESLLVRAIGVGPVAPVHYHNLARSRVRLGKLDSAEATLDQCVQQFPRNVQCTGFRTMFEWVRGRYDSVGVQLARLESKITEPSVRAQVVAFQVDVARLHGRLGETRRLSARANELASQAGARGTHLYQATSEALDVATSPHNPGVVALSSSKRSKLRPRNSA
jgi:Tfp pilus assembly protein PilF